MADGAETDERERSAALEVASNAQVADGRHGPGSSMLCVDAELRQDAIERLRDAIVRAQGFLNRPDRRLSGVADPTRALCASLGAQAETFLRGPLGHRSGRMPSEHTLRSAYRLAGALANLVAWNAPAAQESSVLDAVPPAGKRETVAYGRYGSAEIAAQEAAYAHMLGIDARRARLLLTSSGMAAYALIETFLLREVLEAGDRILLNPLIYFETRHQVQSLRFFDVRTARGGSRQDTLDAIAQHGPRVVFVDPLTNSVELRLIDLPRLLDDAEDICERETWFVVDGTLLSGSFDPFAKAHRRVRVLYYESGCKYLQLGADLGPAGVVAVESALADRFEHWRRGIGAVAADMLVLPRVSRGAYVGFLGQQTACARTIAEAVRRGVQAGAPVIACSFPAEPDHPDFEEAGPYDHLGGVLAFRFLDPRLNCRQPLELFIDRLIAAARLRGVPLTAGVSFGFRVPRVGAAWISYDCNEAFLRLSAGVSLDAARRLGRLLVECAHQFDPAREQAE